ncbi:MAG: hypothetical protein KKF44_11095 [Nanoarchaeota archaeon]|nr:hypothetical protein [Nanoarchaeota archaeon]
MLDDSDIGKIFSFEVRIDDIRKSGGPLLFFLSDSTTTFVAANFSKDRVFTKFRKGDFVTAELKIKKRGNSLEGEFINAEILDERGISELNKKFNSVKDIAEPDFLIKSKALDDLRPELIKAAKRIKSAIYEKRPIMIKHHADCDGYAAAIAIEKAILPLIESLHQNKGRISKYYRRSPSFAPFYEYSDVIRDLGSILENAERFGEALPLIVLLDLGAIEQNLTAIEKLELYDIKVLLIDHHNPMNRIETKKVKEILDVFVNPYFVGFDATLTTGMMCTELARFINPDVKNINHLPALAGTGDKSDKDEFEQYLSLSGIDREYLKRIALCIDYQAHYIRFQESRELVDRLLDINSHNHKKLIEFIYSEIEKKIFLAKQAVQKYVTKNKLDDISLIKIDCEKLSFSDGFPNTSKITRLAHEMYEGKRITLGLLSDSITLRVDSVPEFNVNELVQKLKKTMPYALINGGGHEFAGTLRFVEAAKKDVLNKVDEEIMLLKQKRI